MSKYRRWAAGDRFRPSASQANAWTDAAMAAESARKPSSAGGGGSPFRVVKTTEEHPQEEIQNCIVMTGSKGEEEESDSEIPCYNRFADLPKDAICIAAYIVNGWELIAAECE